MKEDNYHVLSNEVYYELLYKADTLDKIIEKIEQKGNIVRNLSGWAFDVSKIYKHYKEGIKYAAKGKGTI